MFNDLAFLDSDTKEKITFIKKKDINKILEHIDADQLLEQYGGTMKMPQRIWPPVDTYTPQTRSMIQPSLVPETDNNKYLYEPGTNDPKKVLHSVIPSNLFTASDFETRALAFPLIDPEVPSEPQRRKLPQYKQDNHLANIEHEHENQEIQLQRVYLNQKSEALQIMPAESALAFSTKPTSSTILSGSGSNGIPYPDLSSDAKTVNQEALKPHSNSTVKKCRCALI